MKFARFEKKKCKGYFLDTFFQFKKVVKKWYYGNECFGLAPDQMGLRQVALITTNVIVVYETFLIKSPSFRTKVDKYFFIFLLLWHIKA